MTLKSFAPETSLSSLPLEVLHLPPIAVHLVLPSTYPLIDPPKVWEMGAPLPNSQTRQSWLSRSTLRKLQGRLGALWEEEKQAIGQGTGVIWRWWEWISSGEAFTDIGISHDNTLW